MEEIINLFASIATIAGLVLATVTYFTVKSRETKVLTYNRIDELLDRHNELRGKDISKDFMSYVEYARLVERFAYAYNERVFIKALVAKRIGDFLVRIYDSELNPVIKQQRNQFKRPEYYDSIDIMILDLKKRNR